MIQIAGIQINGAPNVSFLLVARVVADRFDRRHITMLTQAMVGRSRLFSNVRPAPAYTAGQVYNSQTFAVVPGHVGIRGFAPAAPAAPYGGNHPGHSWLRVDFRT